MGQGTPQIPIFKKPGVKKLGGRTVEQVVTQAEAALKAAGLRVR